MFCVKFCGSHFDGQGGAAMANTTIVPADGLRRHPRLNSRYRIVSELGSGPFGPVYIAEDTTTGNPVAIRPLPHAAARARGGDVLERISPGIVAASAAHPALVRVLDTGRADSGRPFVVTEFVEGRRLSDVLTSGPPLDVPAGLKMALELGGAVETVHNMGLVHGAVRTRNVMVLAEGRVKLMDLELAGLRDAPTVRLAGEGPSAETPAAEHLRDEVITEKTDVYSFASIVYEMLCGTPPFDTVTADASRQAPQRPAWPRDSRAKIPRSVRRIIEDALSEEPQRRPFMSQLLNRLVLKSSIAPGSRRRIAIVGSVAVATVIVGLLSWGLRTPRETLVTAPTQVTTLVPASSVVATPTQQSPTSRRKIAPPRAESTRPTTAAVPTHPPASGNDEDYDPAAVIDWVLNESRR
jgi:serine/threonine protein kinase